MKIQISKITIVLIAVTAFLGTEPYFQWNTFAGGLVANIYSFLTLLYVLTLAYFSFSRPVSKKALLACVSMLIIYVYLALFTGVVGGNSLPFAFGTAIAFCSFSMLLMVPHEILFKSFDLVKSIYAIIIAITLVVFILVLIGVPLPSFEIGSAEAGRVAYSGQYYKNYLGCLVMFTRYGRVDRFTSVFTEPGVVGTLSAFFIASSGDKIFEDRRNIFIFIGGLLSFSLAFIVMFAMILVIKNFQKGVTKLAVPILLLLIIYFVFLNLKFDNILLQELQMRLSFTGSGLAGDDRISIYAQSQYEAFLHSDLKTVLLGYGNAYANPETKLNFWQGSATYKRQVFQFGVIGFGAYVMWTIFAPYINLKTMDKNRNQRLFTYLAIFVMSMYQRPYPTKLYFIYFLIAGCIYSVYDSKDFDGIEEGYEQI